MNSEIEMRNQLKDAPRAPSGHATGVFTNKYTLSSSTKYAYSNMNSEIIMRNQLKDAPRAPSGHATGVFTNKYTLSSTTKYA